MRPIQQRRCHHAGHACSGMGFRCPANGTGNFAASGSAERPRILPVGTNFGSMTSEALPGIAALRAFQAIPRFIISKLRLCRRSPSPLLAERRLSQGPTGGPKIGGLPNKCPATTRAETRGHRRSRNSDRGWKQTPDLCLWSEPTSAESLGSSRLGCPAK